MALLSGVWEVRLGERAMGTFCTGQVFHVTLMVIILCVHFLECISSYACRLDVCWAFTALASKLACSIRDV